MQKVPQRSARLGREGPARIRGRAEGPRKPRARGSSAGERTVLWGKEKRPGLEEGRGGRVRGGRFWTEGMGVGGGREDADKGGGRQPSCFEKCFLFL